MRATKEKEADDGQKKMEEKKKKMKKKKMKKGRMKCGRCQEDPHLTRVIGCKEWKTVAHNLIFPEVFSLSLTLKKVVISFKWITCFAVSREGIFLINRHLKRLIFKLLSCLLTQETRQTPTQNKVSDVENDCESYSHEKNVWSLSWRSQGKDYEVTAEVERRETSLRWWEGRE